MIRALLVVLLVGVSFGAAADVTSEMIRCGAIEANVKRLQCYDSLARLAASAAVLDELEPSITGVARTSDAASTPAGIATPVAPPEPAESETDVSSA